MKVYAGRLLGGIPNALYRGANEILCLELAVRKMAEIQIEIQGKDSVLAAEELLAISGLSGIWQSVEEVEKEGIVTTIATIVGLVGGTIAIAEQIRKWHQGYKQGKSSKKIEKVLLLGRNGKRLLLENATLEQIKQILEE